MNEVGLRRQLARRTTLTLGNVGTTAMTQTFAAPIGFVSLDLDLYSSTSAALQVRLREDVRLLRRVALDDLDAVYDHRFVGELLAIEEFNLDSKKVKIDQWRRLQSGRPFPDADWLRGM
ncbi:MAG: hypothetical protein ACREXX_10530 [Gammaproteobacteria bacterium]